MYVLGIHDGHNSGAVLLKDGMVLMAINTERLTRIKNDCGYPKLAIEEILNETGITAGQIESVAVASKLWRGHTVEQFINPELWFDNKLKSFWSQLELKIPSLKYIYPALYGVYKVFLPNKNDIPTNSDFIKRLKKDFGIEEKRITFIDHHLSHAASAYYGCPFYKEKVLVMTLDGAGDNICSTVSIGENGRLKRIAQTPLGHSAAEFYAAVTYYLGMKPVEHEYKVMGLAPYAFRNDGMRLYNKIKDLIVLDEKNPLQFKSKIRTSLSYNYMKAAFSRARFDVIAFAAQHFIEELLRKWISSAIKKTGIRKIALAGGIFMNVKANKLLAEIEEVEDIFVFPSCADESLGIGAAMYTSAEFFNCLPLPIKDIYYGRDLDPQEVDKIIEEKFKNRNFEVTKPVDIEKEVARLLAKNEVVARCCGRMEFGARALGNRSILANPKDLDSVQRINRMIKKRDFWMPFAPTILNEFQRDYIDNPKGMFSPYMMLAFAATENGKIKLAAAKHRYDNTVRPQFLKKEYNPKYYKLIEYFKDLTGIGAVLNTSFNLHGEPMVNSAFDATRVFLNSGLRYLQLSDFLIEKL